ncbi:WS/DGAT domain-containing protein [Gordonia aichiensis]
MRRLSAADALPYWMAPIIPNDQFVVYVFGEDDRGRGHSAGDRCEIAAWLARRAARIDDLTLRVLDVPFTLDRPYWVSTGVHSRQIVVDDAAQTWQECLAALADRMSVPLDPTELAWRIHVFARVAGVPGGGDGPGVVVALQISHALGDGRRTAEIARDLFGHALPAGSRRLTLTRVVPDSALRAGTALLGALRLPGQVASMIARGLVAWRRYRRASVEQGRGVPLSRFNVPAGTARTLRTLTVDSDALRIGGAGATVGALVAISMALPLFLGASDDRLVVELTVARTPKNLVRNNFRNVGVDLHVDQPNLAQRARLIADDIAAARRADDDPTRVASRAATAATPAFLTRWGIGRFDPTAVPERVTGVTVVSSVNRGADDLALDGRPVLATTGFPALSPAQGLTHGVHGIGDRVTISLTTAPGVFPDVDGYLASLSAAIDELATCGADDAIRVGRAEPATDRDRWEGNSASRG